MRLRPRWAARMPARCARCGDASRALGVRRFRDSEKAFVRAASKDLVAQPGEALVVAGESQPAAVHAVAPRDQQRAERRRDRRVPRGDERRVARLDGRPAGARQRDRGRRGLDAHHARREPGLHAPADLDFANQYTKVDRRIHFGQPDETASMCTHYLGRSTPLEQWGDVVAEDGTYSVVQPMIAPLFDTKGDLDFLAMVARRHVARRLRARPRDRPRTHTRQSGNSFEKAWRRTLHNGKLENSARAGRSALTYARVTSRATGPS